MNHPSHRVVHHELAKVTVFTESARRWDSAPASFNGSLIRALGKNWNHALERRRRTTPKSGLAPPAQKKAARAITVRLVSATAGGVAGSGLEAKPPRWIMRRPLITRYSCQRVGAGQIRTTAATIEFRRRAATELDH